MLVKEIIDKPTCIPFKYEAAQAKLFFRNGTESFAELKFPKVTTWSEPMELAGSFLGSFIKSLTEHFFDLHSYQISCGIIDKAGKFTPLFSYRTVFMESQDDEIRVDLVWDGKDWKGEI